MCGILGSINMGNTADFLDEIRHRGPDASGIECFEVGVHNVALLHRRLSIVDLSEAGTQPMASSDKKANIIFNGEIYNHSELKNKLSGIPFRGHSDTETIVNYFRAFPIAENLRNLNGIFAIAYLDRSNKRLYLARDRFGVKPLYYFYDGTRLMFSSEIRPIKSRIAPAVDTGVVLNSLRMRFSPAPLTLYDTISKVEPGQMITFDLNSEDLTVHKQYFIQKARIASRKDEHRKLVSEYGDLFEKAVERQLMADVDLGILLSGGVDSALVAAIANEKSQQKIKAFTVGFEGNHTALDEIEYAQETADILGLDHYVKKIEFTDFLASIRKIVNVVEEPIATTSIIPMYFLSELAASHVKVVLSGQGADEPLGGYYKYKALPFLEKARSIGGLGSLADKLDFIYKKNEHLRRFFKAFRPKDKVLSWMEFNAISSFDEILEILDPSFYDSGLRSLKQKQEIIYEIWKNRVTKDQNLTDLFLYCDVRTSLADDLLMYTDKITMHFGLECRVPILDNDLMEFIESLDKVYKFNSKKGKIIHKAFAQDYLPSSIIERKKLGFKSPTETWFREEVNELERVFAEKAVFQQLFDKNKVEHLLHRHKKGKNLEKQIFQLLSLNYLLQAGEGI